MHERVQASLRHATVAFAGKTYGSQPYTKHLHDVFKWLRHFGISDPDLLAAGFSHDTLEDTPTTREELAFEIGTRSAELVWRVTNEPGKNRRERNKATYPKIAEDPDAVKLKLVDRLANVASCVETKDRKLSMYRREYPEFRAALWSEGGMDDVTRAMWTRLDDLLEWKETERVSLRPI